jgi:hypothetical protein
MSIKTLPLNRSKARSEKRFPNITLTELKGWERNCENLADRMAKEVNHAYTIAKQQRGFK